MGSVLVGGASMGGMVALAFRAGYRRGRTLA